MYLQHNPKVVETKRLDLPTKLVVIHGLPSSSVVETLFT
jgi:hypothetical protein